jgi:hypothetical protein
MEMELGIFTPSRPADDFNGVPEPSKRRGLFWEWTAGLLGLPDASDTVPLRFQGLGASRDNDVNWQIDAVARRDRRIAELNNAVPFRPTFGEVVSEMVEAVRRVTKTDRAKAWLAERLQEGPVAQQVIEAEGRKAGFTLKLLKVVKKRLRVVSVRKGANNWRWQLPMAMKAKATGE